MENFKSFGKKLTVPFFPGFTAITGPNGSGKSNIADAILFVLGPKSSKVMRAGRLTDLIFNGGKKRKNPAKNCKVSLVFDNKKRKMPVDDNEVVLTRMIKRAPLKDNPENYYSKFYVNGKSATFSDFEKILNHARMSGDGYNIVKQGDVTSLIEMGNVDRRRIIDGIAGISNFDNDIKKAEKERVEVDENLDRIKIILNEINSQIRQLKNDRDEAYRYQELKEKLYEIKTKIALKKKQDVEEQISEINKQIESYEKEKEKIDEKSRNLKKEYSEKQKILEEVEEKIADVGGDEVKELKEKIEKIREEEIKIEERINYSNQEIRDFQDEKNKFKENLENFTNELNEHSEKQKELEEKEKVLKELKEDIAQSDDKSMDLAHDLAKMREEYNEKNTEIHELKLKRNRFTDKIESLETQISEMEETKQTYEFEIKDINWQLEENKKEGKNKNKEKNNLEKNLFEKKKKEAELSEELTDLENAIRRLQREQSKLQAELDAAESVQGRYNHAVNTILKARNTGQLNGIIGTIAELAKVDETYKTAVEVAAGGRMQSVVVKNDKDAADAIRFLQKQKLGRATFLPLNKMITGKPRGKPLLAVKDERAHGFAIDLVKFDEKYHSAFWHVFRDTVVVETLDDARRLMGGVRLVDLKGSLVESCGAMVGGSVSKSRLSFTKTDRSKLEKISEELYQAMSHQDKISEEIADIRKEIKEIENNLGEIRTKVDDTNIKDQEIRKKEFSKKVEVITKEIEEKNKEKLDLTEKKNEILEKIKEYKIRLEELDKIKEEKGKLLLKGTKKEFAQKTRTLESEVTELANDIRNLKSEKDTFDKKIELLIERKNEIEEKIQNETSQTEEHQNNVEELKEERSKLRDKLNALMKVEEKMTGKIKDLTENRDEIYKETVKIENDIDKLNTRIESYYDLISRAKYRLPTLDATIKELNQEIKLYDAKISDELKLPNVESLKDSMNATEENMRELEPVNMRALEEYEHQSERKKKLDEDVKHLKEQKKNLQKLVNNITDKKKERFFEVYDAVNKNLKEIYGQLSEGGEAELKLEDEENLFESGLTIKARPRGKKVLLLSALSGGEKSIASLAFIFAIQRYDPSPFYVLDEVDMFLDGINAETVSRMVKKRAQDSQFIMVSLRKIALKEANHVYGVTMRDTGVSDMIGNLDPSAVGPKGEIKTEGGKMVAAG